MISEKERIEFNHELAECHRNLVDQLNNIGNNTGNRPIIEEELNRVSKMLEKLTDFYLKTKG